jgi:hypothetical protein
MSRATHHFYIQMIQTREWSMRDPKTGLTKKYTYTNEPRYLPPVNFFKDARQAVINELHTFEIV